MAMAIADALHHLLLLEGFLGDGVQTGGLNEVGDQASEGLQAKIVGLCRIPLYRGKTGRDALTRFYPPAVESIHPLIAVHKSILSHKKVRVMGLFLLLLQ